jgi:hypothetical protein
MAGILFEDIFDVKDIDPEGKKFDRGKWGVFEGRDYLWGMPLGPRTAQITWPAPTGGYFP